MLIENWQLPSPTDWGLHGFRAWGLTEDVLLVEAVYQEADYQESVQNEADYQEAVPAAGTSSQVEGIFRQRCLDCFLSLKQSTLEHLPDWANTVEWAPAYVSMGIRFDPKLQPIEQLWKELKNVLEKGLENVLEKGLENVLEKGLEKGFADVASRANELASTPAQVFELPVCYDKGLDWPRIEDFSGLSKNEFIQRHSRGEYWVAAMGFLPGFVFLDGLDPALSLPRLDAPRTRIPAGTVGIGGGQTGWYALSSPGGWNSLGETPLVLLDPQAGARDENPSPVQVGDRVRFRAVDEQEFDALKNELDFGDLAQEPEQGLDQGFDQGLDQDSVENSVPVSSDDAGPITGELARDSIQDFVSFEVLEPGLWTSLQDRGRSVGLAYGLPRSGVADLLAYEAALEAVGGQIGGQIGSPIGGQVSGKKSSQKSRVVLECTLKGPVLRCLSEATIVLTGADFQVRCERTIVTSGKSETTIRDKVTSDTQSWIIPLHTLVKVKAGDVLRWGYSQEGCRGYMAVRAGDYAGQRYWGSVSGLAGRGAFTEGQIIRLKHSGQGEGQGAEMVQGVEMVHNLETLQKAHKRQGARKTVERFAGTPRFRCRKGPEWDWISEEFQEYVMGSEYEVGSDSNRMGIRLSRRVVDEARERDWRAFLTELPSMWSSVVRPGIIQLPPSGQPIVLGPDGQTIGGYPRIAYVPQDQQWRLAQLHPGDQVRLGWV